jgi:hypothetical protein
LPSFLSAFEELLEYLHLDPRLSGGQAAELVPPEGCTYRVLSFRRG